MRIDDNDTTSPSPTTRRPYRPPRAQWRMAREVLLPAGAHAADQLLAVLVHHEAADAAVASPRVFEVLLGGREDADVEARHLVQRPGERRELGVAGLQRVLLHL